MRLVVTVILLLGLRVWNLPALAADDLLLRPAIQADGTTISSVSSKPPFRVRHPKLHKAYRGARWFVIKTKPFVEWTAACSQIVTPYLIGSFQ